MLLNYQRERGVSDGNVRGGATGEEKAKLTKAHLKRQ